MNTLIHIHEDGIGVLKIESWQDIIERQGFHVGIDPDKQKLKRIVGQYWLPEKHPCGLSICCQPHNKGYLIVVEGGLTNVGNRCGKKYFGVEWNDAKNSFQKDLNTQRYIERLLEFKNQLEPHISAVSLIRQSDSENILKKMHLYATRHFEGRTIDALRYRSVRGDAIVTMETRNRSEDERDIARLTGSNSNIHTHTLFIISGVKAFTSYKKLKQLLSETLGWELSLFPTLDPLTMDFNNLKRWHSWANKLDSQINAANEILAECVRFLHPDNIANIRQYKSFL